MVVIMNVFQASGFEMPAITESVYRIPSLTPDVLNDGHSGDVPEDLYDEAIKPLIDELHAKGMDPNIPFEPERHILFTDDFYEKTRRLTLSDLQQENPHQKPISDVGVSEPFPLFTDEAIDIMRYEVLCKKNFLFGARISEHSNTGDLDFYSVGHPKENQQFTYAAWHHPKVLEIMSRMADVELVNMMDYEVGHSNITVKTSKTKIINTLVEPTDVVDQTPESIQASLTWHYDSPQYVCVVMFSDTTSMIGGETALLMGNGKVTKVAGPRRGWANILQGRVLRHIATKPKGDFTERITSVASFRPRDALMDNCAMTTIKPSKYKGSRYSEFYKGWMEYRLNVLSERILILKDQLNKKYKAGLYFDQLETVEFIQKKIIEYAEHTYQEFEAVDDGIVEKPTSYDVVQARWE